MHVSLRFFASLREAMGRREMGFDLDDGSSVDDLRSRLGCEYPALQPLMTTVVFAINDEYVAVDEKLREGVEVALIPPVSGGAEPELYRLTYDRIDGQALAD